MDVLGEALHDFYLGCSKGKLKVDTSYGKPELMPVEAFFRTAEELPPLEEYAMTLCRGRILDIGAGAGCHSLILQDRQANITALEISEKASQVISLRGVKQVIQADIMTDDPGRYDTLLLMMNGIGLCGDLRGLKLFLDRAQTFLNPGGQLIFDSSDISYLYNGTILPQDLYFGEVSFRYVYNKKRSDWFRWLYIDAGRLGKLLKGSGWKMQVVYENGYDQYLVRLTQLSSLS